MRNEYLSILPFCQKRAVGTENQFLQPFAIPPTAVISSVFLKFDTDIPTFDTGGAV